MCKCATSVVIVPILTMLAGCVGDGGSPGRVWNGSVDTLASGAIEVSNEGPGMWGEATPRLVEAMRIGSAVGDGPDVFGGIAAVGIAPSGLIHVLDAQAQEIHVFTRGGTYVRTIGGEGGGPGELDGAVGFAWDEDGNLWVVEIGNGRYSVFDAEGQYLESYPRNLAGVIPWVAGFGAGGRLYDVSVRTEMEGAWEFVYYALDSSLIPIDTFPPIAYRRTSEPIPPAAAALVPRTTFAFDPTGFVWFGKTDEYRITKRSLNGDTTLILSLARQPARTAESTMDSIIDEVRESENAMVVGTFGRADIPARMPYFERIIVDDQGRPIVMAIAEDGAQVLDFFDEDGRYLGTVRPPVELGTLQPPVVRGDTLLGVATDKVGVQYVVELHLERHGGDR